MLKDFPRLQRWEETDDVLQNASIRLWNALKQVQPDSPQHIFRLAALQIRRELINLMRSYYGQEGHGAQHASNGPVDSSNSTPPYERSDSTLDPGRLARWTEFHQKIELLPEVEREVFDLLWYQGLSQAEAAVLLEVSERTIQRRWQTARLKVYRALDGELPG